MIGSWFLIWSQNWMLLIRQSSSDTVLLDLFRWILIQNSYTGLYIARVVKGLPNKRSELKTRIYKLIIFKQFDAAQVFPIQ